jgi:hypothetical protein
MKTANINGFAAVINGKLKQETFSATEIGAISRAVHAIKPHQWRKGITVKVVKASGQLIAIPE